jgi:hypothetical protein
MLGLSIFQKKDFLAYIEDTNPCGQRYHLLMEGDAARAGCVTYSLRLNMFTYARMSLSIPMTICGIPCSQSWPGLIGAPDSCRELLDLVGDGVKGLFLALNLLSPITGFLSGSTLPAIMLDLRQTAWEDYAAALRHGYRRRLSRILAKSAGIVFKPAAFAEFDEAHYALYLNVYRASDEKLELLPLPVFRSLGQPFFMERCLIDGKLAGWYIALGEGDAMIFFLCGLDYSFIATHELYLAILYRILRLALERGCARVEYGQTSEPSKLKIGGYASPRYMAARHSNPIMRVFLRVFKSALEYRFVDPSYRVFKDAE